MFGFIKDKLKNWKDKIVEEFSEPVEKQAKTKIKSKKEKIEKKIKPAQKTEKAVGNKNVASGGGRGSGAVAGRPESIKSQPGQKKSFLSKLFSHEENKTSELVIEDIKKEGIEIKGEEQRFEEEQKKHEGFFDRFKKKITQEKFDELFSELEMTLLQNNIAYQVVEHMKKKLSEELVGKNLSEVNIEKKLRETISEILINPPILSKQIKEQIKTKKPFVIAFVGINGSGKTTSIAKVANYLKKEKLSVCLAAADTFRAAAIEQLEIHANKIGIPIIKKEYNSDPAAVGFEAIAYAKKHGIDVVLIDTAGRMNTKESLMKEMEKIIRVCQPDLKMFLGESITGNDATEQARAFNQSISIDGIILSKADIDEKGGAALSVSYITKKPIYFLGTGQKYEDLEIFDKEKILKSLGL
jgi:fused signal recognition particle receptor